MSTPGASSNMMQHAAQSSMMNHISPSDAMLMQEAAPSDAMMMQAAVPDNSMAMHPAPASSMMMHEAAPATPVAMFPAGADSMTMQAADSMAMQHADSMKMQPADSMSMMHVDEKASESMTMQQAAPADSMMAMHAAPAGSMMQHVEEKRASSGGMTRRKSVPPSMMTAETASMPPPFQSTAEVYDVSGINHPGVAKSALPAYWISDRPAGYYEKYPNPWSRVREFIREPMAELIATMLFVFVGLNANCQVLLTQNKAISDFPFGSFISIPFTWSLGAACAVWVAAGISGAHINPAGTIAAAIYRGFPWRKVPVYIFAQLLGGFFAGLLTYANWYHAIDIAEGGKGIRTVPGTAAIFTAYAPDFVPNANAFFDEFLMSFILIIVVFAFTDKHNAPPPPYIAPLAIFACVFALISGFAFNSGFTLDPARDFGPRLATAIFYGSEVWTFRHQYWLWCSWGAPVSGAIVAGAVYDGFLYIGPEALVNRRSAAARRWAAAEQYSRDRQMQGLPATA